MINQSNYEHDGIPTEKSEPTPNPLNVLHNMQRKLQHRRVNRVIEKLPRNFEEANNTRNVKISTGSLGMRVSVAWEGSYYFDAHTVEIDIGGDDYSGNVNSVEAKKKVYIGREESPIITTFSSFESSEHPNTLDFSEIMRNLTAAQKFTEQFVQTSAANPNK